MKRENTVTSSSLYETF